MLGTKKMRSHYYGWLSLLEASLPVQPLVTALHPMSLVAVVASGVAGNVVVGRKCSGSH